MKVVLTGAAGFIGGQTLLKLVDFGHDVLAIDRVQPPGHLMPIPCQWYIGDFVSELGLDAIKLFCPDAVIHCAGTSLVGPSINNPKEYYDNNFVKTKILLDHLINYHDKKVRFIFSSSAATYGNPSMTPCREIDPCEPISPYGQSKLMIDWMLQSYQHAYLLDSISFRYFNACGADSQVRHGQAPGATHIIAKVLEAIKNQVPFTLHGTDYSTKDGTCVRDYIHVEDLADVHVLSLDKKIPNGIYNLGTGSGFSNLDIIKFAKQITSQNFSIVTGPRREGDPAILTANPAKFWQASLWRPKFEVYSMVEHAWAWYNR